MPENRTQLDQKQELTRYRQTRLTLPALRMRYGGDLNFPAGSTLTASFFTGCASRRSRLSAGKSLCRGIGVLGRSTVGTSVQSERSAPHFDRSDGPTGAYPRGARSSEVSVGRESGRHQSCSGGSARMNAHFEPVPTVYSPIRGAVAPQSGGFS